VLAVDRDVDRLAMLRASASRLSMTLPTAVHDWTQGPLPPEKTGAAPFDAVLVDAPCTAVGTIRRNPEIRWRRAPDDPARAAELQAKILAAASSHVAPRGRLVYAVCSPEPEESTAVIDRFLATNEGFRLLRTCTSAPPRQGEDAFGWAVLERR
jgi:16S rRNA (cytosine967-C5)-methyltransferase